MRVGKSPKEVECVYPEKGKIRIGKDPSQEQYVADNPMTPVDVAEATPLLNRLRVGRGSESGKVGSTYTMSAASTGTLPAQGSPMGSGDAGSGSGSGGGG